MINHSLLNHIKKVIVVCLKCESLPHTCENFIHTFIKFKLKFLCDFKTHKTLINQCLIVNHANLKFYAHL